MKHLFNTLSKLMAVAAVGLSISSCNRAEYAMLPKTTPYHATYGSVVKAAPAKSTEETIVVAEPTTLQAEKAVAVEVEVPATTTPATTSTIAAPAVTAPAARVARTATPVTAQVGQPVAHKQNFTKRLALNKVGKQLDKLASKAQIKQHSETAKANAINGNLRTGIILLIVGALITILPGSIFTLIGSIIAIIGLIFIILWLLDQA